MTANIAVQHKFDHIAANYQRKYEQPQTLMADEKRRRMGLLLDHVTELRPDSVLDAGCGAGNALADLRERLPHVHLAGVDISYGMLSMAQASNGASVPFTQSLIEDLPVADGSFDVVYALGVIDYLAHQPDFFAGTARILRPGGHLLFTYPNAQSLYRTIRDSVKGMIGYGRERVSARPLSAQQIDAWLEANGLELLTRHFITFGNGVVFLPGAVTFNRLMEHNFGRNKVGQHLGWSAFCIARKR